MFYGHSNDVETDIAQWWLIDLSALRGHLILESYMRKTNKTLALKIDENIPNGDGTYFWAFHINSFPKDPSLIIAASNK